jgi:hypothetical protein
MSELETCIKFGEQGARVMIENNETPHYKIHVDEEKKEVTCWVESQAEKVCEFLFTMISYSFQQI